MGARIARHHSIRSLARTAQLIASSGHKVASELSASRADDDRVDLDAFNLDIWQVVRKEPGQCTRAEAHEEHTLSLLTGRAGARAWQPEEAQAGGGHRAQVLVAEHLGC